jgi:hypothetical protein
MVKSQQSAQGVVVTRYVRDGEVDIGTFTSETPNEAELARRSRLAREKP